MRILKYIIRKLIYTESTPKIRKTYIDERGYTRFKDSHKLVHRWVAEKKLGRKLMSNEVVHHKNRNKLDNRPENLVIYSSQFNHHMRHAVHKIITNRW